MEYERSTTVAKLTEKKVILISGVIFLITLLGILSIDVFNLFGTRTFLINNNWDKPFFWYHWYRNGGPFEIAQYSFLGFTAIYSARNSMLGDRNNKRFWAVFTIAVLYLLIEDAGDPRHFIREYVQIFVGETDGQGIWGTVTELVYFAILGSVPVYAYFRYGHQALKNFLRTKSFLLSGFFFYGLAGASSFIGSAFEAVFKNNIYMIIGKKIISGIVYFGDIEIEKIYTGPAYNTISYTLMDSPYEESLELIGGTLLLLAAVSFMRIYYKELKDANKDLH